MRTVNVRQLRMHLARLLDDVAAGEELVVTRSGRPVARLVPAAAPEPRVPGVAKGGRVTEGFFAPLPDEELDAWEP